MKYFVLYRYYMDCPTCDGTGDMNFKIINSQEELISFIVNGIDQFEVESIFDESEKIAFEVIVNMSFHRIHGAEIKELENKKRSWKINRPHGKWEIQEG